MQTEQLRVTGMTCGGCATKVAKALKKIPGVGDVDVTLSSGEASVEFDELLTSPKELRLAVKSAGYGTETTDSHNHKSKGGCCS